MSNFLCNIDLNGNQILNGRFQILATDPAGPDTGDFYYNSTTNEFRYWNGTIWVSPSVETTTTLTNTVSGHRIGTYTNEVAAAVDINETITTFDTSTSGQITYTAENGSGFIFDQVPITVTTDGNGTGVVQSGPANSTVDITLVSADGNNALTSGSDGGVYFNALEQDVVASIPARDALTDLQNGQMAWVLQASGDPTVNNGAALYVYNASASGWDKVSEFESMDLGFSVVTNTQPSGNLIATHNDGQTPATIVNINETITTFTASASGVEYTSEDGTVTNYLGLQKYCETINTSGGVASTVTHSLGTTDVDVAIWSGTTKSDACVVTNGVNAVDVTTTNNQTVRVCVIG